MKLQIYFLLLTLIVPLTIGVSCSAPPRNEQINRVRNSVVSITLRRTSDGAEDKAAFGTGFFISENLIATAFHVHRDMSEAVNNSSREAKEPIARKQSRTQNRKFSVPLTLVTTDEANDLAIYSFSPSALAEQWREFELTPLKLAETLPDVGEEVFLAGFHYNYLFPFTSVGSVAMIDEKANVYADLTLMPGNSGSPLCSLRTGEVVGVNERVMFAAENRARMGIATNSLHLRRLLATVTSDAFKNRK